MSVFYKQKRFILTWVLFSSLAIAVYRIYIITNNIEIDSVESQNYYLFDNAETYIFALLTAVIIAAFILAAVFLSRRLRNCLVFGEPSIIFTSSLSGFLLLGAVFYYIFYYTEDTNGLSFLDMAIIISAVISAIYLLLNASGKTECNGKAAAWFSLAPIAFFAFRLLNDFIRQSTTHNASSTNYLLLSLIAFLLFFLAESKFRIGTGSITLYIVFGFLSILLSLIYSLPTLILAAFWVFPTNYTMLYSAIDLTLVMYIAARVCQLNCIETIQTNPAPSIQS
jgi:hypothetical protein